jgi:6-pyruvoyltetrahydropterin/6-carboxytetrahydropterin synthase
MLTITKEFHFSASHVLDRLPSWHPCARMHGHNYVVVLELSARREDLTEAGFVRDYRELDAFKKWMDDTLDHRHLNEAMGGGDLSVCRESGCMDLRPLDRAFPRVDRSQGL